MNWRYGNDDLYEARRELAMLTSEAFAKCVYPPPPPGDYFVWEGPITIAGGSVGETYTITFKTNDSGNVVLLDKTWNTISED